MKRKQQDIYGGNDPRDLAAYGITEAARYIKIPERTLRSWVVGRHYTAHSGRPFFSPLITLPEENPPQLSFNNLIEAHVLRALRTRHKVSIHAARDAIRFAEERYHINRLFLRPELQAGAGDLFLQRYGELVHLNMSGQLVLKEMLTEHLERIETDTLKVPVRFYPFSRTGKRNIVIDPRISFGRPVIQRRGVSTAAIVDRIDAGEAVDEIAADYGLAVEEVTEAVVYEQAA